MIEEVVIVRNWAEEVIRKAAGQSGTDREHRGMVQLDSPRIADALLAASPVTLLALTVRDERLRRRAAERLAAMILCDEAEPDPRQMTLPSL